MGAPRGCAARAAGQRSPNQCVFGRLSVWHSLAGRHAASAEHIGRPPLACVEAGAIYKWKHRSALARRE